MKWYNWLNLTGIRGKPLFRDVQLSWESSPHYQDWVIATYYEETSKIRIFFAMLLFTSMVSGVIIYNEASRPGGLTLTTIIVALTIGIVCSSIVYFGGASKKKHNPMVYISAEGIHFENDCFKYNQLTSFNIVPGSHKGNKFDILVFRSKSNEISMTDIDKNIDNEHLEIILNKHLFHDNLLLPPKA